MKLQLICAYNLRCLFIFICLIFPATVYAENTAPPTKVIKEVQNISTSINAETSQPNHLASDNKVKESNDITAMSDSRHSNPEVGKHVMANMDPASMIISLFLVLGLIVLCAIILKRFNLTQSNLSQLNVVTTLRLGTKERLVVVQVGEQQLLLGVTAQKITHLETLKEPLTSQTIKTGDLPKNILSFLSSKKTDV